MKVQVRFYGVFRTAAGTEDLVLDLPDEKLTVRALVRELVSRERFQDLRQLLIDSSSADPRPNALIMVSGKEINALQGLETALTEKDDLALLPIAHGG